MKLYAILLGCKPHGRNIEQHDIFFTICEDINYALPAIKNFWPEGGDNLHIDSWREVTAIEGCKIQVVNRDSQLQGEQELALFFINLGGYKKDDFEEHHYKMIIVAESKTEAIAFAKHSVFYRHTGFKGAESHIDDKYGIDVDDIYRIEDILPVIEKTNFRIVITREENLVSDKLHIGYLKLSKLE